MSFIPNAADPGDLMREGSPQWLLVLFGILAFPTGLLLWNGLGPHFGLGKAGGTVERGAAMATSSCLRQVARGALAILGRLAGGEPAAFVGAVRLKACPTITRQRIGIDFRLLPDRVQVVDLIPRQNLERKIKTLV